MLLTPCYNENITVGVIRGGKFHWYVTDRIVWFLDYLKHCRCFWPDFMPGDSCDVEYRFNIFTVDEAHEEEFFEHLKPYEASVEELREGMKACTDDDFVLGGFEPVMLADFDKKHFVSYYPEPASYEDFVPCGWTSEYRPLDDDIPEDMRFWIDTDGTDLFEKLHERMADINKQILERAERSSNERKSNDF